MRTKEEYYEDTLKNRALLESQEVLDCSCPYSRCEWHGKCRECVALPRYHAEHLPCCLQPLLREKITVLAGCCEMETTSRVKESEKFREYVKEQDAVRSAAALWQRLRVLPQPAAAGKEPLSPLRYCLGCTQCIL